MPNIESMPASKKLRIAFYGAEHYCLPSLKQRIEIKGQSFC